jgi:ubiquitin-conjugating enzyme E2 Q
MKRNTQYTHLSSKNAKLNGRKRFNADLQDMVDACAQGFNMYNLNLTRAYRESLHGLGTKVMIGISSGDDEGNVEFVVAQGTKELIGITLMVSGK